MAPEMVLVRDACAVAFDLEFPNYRLVSEKYRGRTVTATFSGDAVNVNGEALRGFDADFARAYMKHTEVEAYYNS